ncbi:hypothetical protein AB0F68_04445 [Micromonospora sp. NPDC023966]|uniref:hypothetical protein n=1 Tax=Micromonospora sp. NPDC023966 TaxID=3154699 RepID=UPI0033CBB4D3
MDNLTTALAELPADDLDSMISEFVARLEFCLETGRNEWANAYRALAVAAITALESK